VPACFWDLELPVTYVRDVGFCSMWPVPFAWRPIPTSRLNLLEALRRDAGVMFGEVSSSDPECEIRELRVGVLGRLESWDRLLVPEAVLVFCGRTREREDVLMLFNAPGFCTFRWKLTLVTRVDLIEGSCFRRFFEF
jgi:hypothetical protein